MVADVSQTLALVAHREVRGSSPGCPPALGSWQPPAGVGGLFHVVGNLGGWELVPPLGVSPRLWVVAVLLALVNPKP